MKKRALWENLILAIVAAGLLWGIIALVFDFYYDLNDDILIKDIISGIYTGKPDAHNNQMMYPISILFVFLYNLIPGLPWFGIAEIACFVISFVILLRHLLTYLEPLWQRLLLTIVFTITFATLYIWEIVMLQYTVVSGMLCIAATVIVYTHSCHKIKEPVAEYIKAMIPAILLLVLAYNFRSEMFLLMCPFMGATGIARWLAEPEKNDAENYKGIFDLANIKKYFSFIAVIIATIILTTVIDKVAYSSSDWREFRQFFDARTEVYDFTGIPDYNANSDFYEGQGITLEQYSLLVNYNFAIDEDIDAELLNTVADFAKSGKALNPDGTPYSRTYKTLKTSIGEYIRNISDIEVKKDYDASTPFADEAGQFGPFAVIIMLLYVAVFVAAFYGKKKKLYLSFLTLFAFRSIAWIFVLHRGRILPRITHPMYLIEIVILVMMLLNELKEAQVRVKDNGRTGSSGPEVIIAFCCITAVLFIIVSVGCIRTQWSEVKEKGLLRDNLNRQECMLTQTLEKQDKYYYLDVYSTVGWTEKVFTGQNSKRNQQLAGGWMAFSPLNNAKRSAYADDYYFVTSQNIDEMKWFRDWLYAKTDKQDAEIELTDVFDSENGQLFVYNIPDVTKD